jgi:hypothetical protein
MRLNPLKPGKPISSTMASNCIRCRNLQTGLPVWRGHDAEPVFIEPFAQELKHARPVFNNKNAHEFSQQSNVELSLRYVWTIQFQHTYGNRARENANLKKDSPEC